MCMYYIHPIIGPRILGTLEDPRPRRTYRTLEDIGPMRTQEPGGPRNQENIGTRTHEDIGPRTHAAPRPRS